MPDLDALDHEHHLDRAIDLAREAGERGDGPYGSLLVRDGTVVDEATNRTRTESDLAEHPELTLARLVGRRCSPAESAATVMYTSTEPCPMCATGLAYAGVGAVVFAVSNEQRAAECGGTAGIPCEEVVDRLGAAVDVVGPTLPEAGLAVHRDHPR